MPFLTQEQKEVVQNAKSIVAITGAGISNESGIPTFRGEAGFWKNFRAEDLATPQAFQKDPKLVWEWYDWRRLLCSKANPNDGHLTLASWDNHHPRFSLITQNVDGLHIRAGSKHILEIHGNIFQFRCTKCSFHGHIDNSRQGDGLKFCPNCSALVRPNIVWFGESYDPKLFENAFLLAQNASVVLLVGTSANVSVPRELAMTAIQSGAFGIEINPESTSLSEFMDVHIQGKAGDVLPKLYSEIIT
ncbi:NAD-dependent deacylase [Leptospira sp. 96542]|nr:NAD-dependent deacylase [Leptospira sp. 96542]